MSISPSDIKFEKRLYLGRYTEDYSVSLKGFAFARRHSVGKPFWTLHRERPINHGVSPHMHIGDDAPRLLQALESKRENHAPIHYRDFDLPSYKTALLYKAIRRTSRINEADKMTTVKENWKHPLFQPA